MHKFPHHISPLVLLICNVWQDEGIIKTHTENFAFNTTCSTSQYQVALATLCKTRSKDQPIANQQQDACWCSAVFDSCSHPSFASNLKHFHRVHSGQAAKHWFTRALQTLPRERCFRCRHLNHEEVRLELWMWCYLQETMSNFQLHTLYHIKYIHVGLKSKCFHGAEHPELPLLQKELQMLLLKENESQALDSLPSSSCKSGCWPCQSTFHPTQLLGCICPSRSHDINFGLLNTHPFINCAVHQYVYFSQPSLVFSFSKCF